MACKLTGGEVAGRQATRLVDDIHQDVGPILSQSLADRMIDKGLGEDLVGGLEFFRLGNIDLSVLRVDGDELDPFGPHHRAQPPASGRPKVAVGILDRDIGGGQLHLTGRSDGDDALLSGKTAGKGSDNLKIAFADEFRFQTDGDPIRTDGQAVPGITCRFSFQDKGFAATAGKELGCSAAGVGLLDGPGQRAFRPNGESSGVGGGGA